MIGVSRIILREDNIDPLGFGVVSLLGVLTWCGASLGPS